VTVEMGCRLKGQLTVDACVHDTQGSATSRED